MAHTVVIARDGWSGSMQGDRTVRLPVASITPLELYRGQDRSLRVLRNFALIGAGTGTLIGLYTGSVASGHTREGTPGNEPECVSAPWSDGEMTRWVFGSAEAGALVFVLTAAIHGEERWERLLPSRAALVPVPGGVGGGSRSAAGSGGHVRNAALVTIVLLGAAADLHAQALRVVVGDRVRADAPMLRVRRLEGRHPHRVGR